MSEQLSGAERDPVFGEKSQRALDLIRAVDVISQSLPVLDYSEMQIKAIRFDEGAKIDGLNVALQAGVVFGINNSGVYGVPGRTRAILDALEIPYELCGPKSARSWNLDLSELTQRDFE